MSRLINVGYQAWKTKLLVCIENRESPDHTASDPGLRCLFMPIWPATGVQNFRTFTIYIHAFIVSRYDKISL